VAVNYRLQRCRGTSRDIGAKYERLKNGEFALTSGRFAWPTLDSKNTKRAFPTVTSCRERSEEIPLG